MAALRLRVAVLPVLFALCSPLRAEPVLPPDSAYVVVGPEGHLVLNSQRVRFWGTITNYLPAYGEGQASLRPKPDDTQEVRLEKAKRIKAGTVKFADRLKALGFNMVRTWDAMDFTAPYKVGDGSPQDLFAFAMNELDKRGIRLWLTQFNLNGNVGPDDVDVVSDPATREAWMQAVAELPKKGEGISLRSQKLYNIDPRMRALRLERMREVADFPNHYKGGLRLADDPQVAVWELTNEEWWLARMLNGEWQKYPAFFRSQMEQAWVEFLRKTYKTDEALTAAWGFLLPGESLAGGRVQLAPLAKPVANLALNDVNPEAISALTAAKQEVSRDDFTRQRGSDVIAFFLETVTTQKVMERDFVKTLGRSCKLSPLVLDTGDGFRIQTVGLHQLGDAVAMCTYLEGYGKDPQEKRFPWYSYLDEAPRMSHDIPWVEVGRVPGKPYFVYETQTMNPFMYRAEFPYRLLALAAIQDWDIINWHCFPRPPLAEEERPYDRAMELANAGFPAEGFHFRYDEVQMAAMRLAGLMFREGAFKPAPNPTLITWGRKDLFDPASMDYGKSFGALGERLAPTTFRHGLHMRVDDQAEKTTVVGPTVAPRVHEANPVRPTDQIAFDWHRSHLLMDSPSAAVYTGFAAQYGGAIRFPNAGVEIDNIKLINPEGVAFPVKDTEKFIAFGIASSDGKPLPEAREILLSLVSSSFNSGFEIIPENFIRRKVYEGMKRGSAPVLVTRVGATLTSKALEGMRYTFLDWHFQPIGSGTVGVGGRLDIPAEKPIFLISLRKP